MEEYSIFYKIKEFEKSILKALTKPMTDSEIKSKMKYKSSPTQMRIADYLLNNIEKDDISQKEIEEALKLSKATVSDVLNRMEKNGLIERLINPNDTRSKIIVLSKNAKKNFEINLSRLKELEKKAKKNIKQDELELFSKTLNKMIQNLDSKQE